MSRLFTRLVVVLGVLGCGGGGGASTRPAPAKPANVEQSDPAAVAAAAGTWELKTVNGKPLPFLLPTKVTLNTASITFNADGTFTSGGTWVFDGKSGSSGGDGTFIAADTRLTMQSNGGNDTLRIGDDGLTRIGDSDVYVYKRAAPGTVPIASGASSDPLTALMATSQTAVIEAGLKRYANAANARGPGFAPVHATGTKWTMWPDVAQNTTYWYAIFVPLTARNPQATLKLDGETFPFKRLDGDAGKMQVLVVKVAADTNEPFTEGEVNYTCETPEMALLVLYYK